MDQQHHEPGTRTAAVSSPGWPGAGQPPDSGSWRGDSRAEPAPDAGHQPGSDHRDQPTTVDLAGHLSSEAGDARRSQAIADAREAARDAQAAREAARRTPEPEPDDERPEPGPETTAVLELPPDRTNRPDQAP